MASISAETFTWAGLEVTYNTKWHRIIHFRRGNKRRWLSLYNLTIEEAFIAHEATDYPVLRWEMHPNEAFAFYLACEREGLLDPDLPETTDYNE